MEKYKLNNEKCDGSTCWSCQFTWCCDKYIIVKSKVYGTEIYSW